MFSEFFRWWGSQLLDAVPPVFRQAASSRESLIADATQPQLLTFSRQRRGITQPLGQMRLDEAPPPALRAALNSRNRSETVTLRVPASAVLERSVILPLAAERDPEGVLNYEMERLTPFASNEVYWAWSVAERDKSRARLVLRLMLVPRATVDGLVALLAGLGGRPSTIEAPGLEASGLEGSGLEAPGLEPSGERAGAAGPRRITLSHAPATGASRILSPHVLGLVAAGLTAAAVLSPFLRQSIEIDSLQDRIATMAPRVRQAEALQKQINGAGAGNDAVAAETRRVGDALAALAAVTDILPDDSYLTEFTMRERKMTLSGLSASAPRLINDLSADTRIRNPAFTAPVTKSETNHLDVFSIRAEAAN